MELIQFEEHSTVRVKFASTRGRRMVSDAISEYAGLVPAPGESADWFPPGWKVAETRNIETLTAHSRRAWRVRSADGDVALVEHETGIEILVAIGTNVVAAPIVAFIAGLWHEWQRRRRETLASRAQVLGGPGVDTLVVETTADAPDGTRLQRTRAVPAAQLTDAQLEQILKEELRRQGTPGPAPPASFLAFPIPDGVGGYVLLAAGAALVGLAVWRADEPSVAPIFALFGAAMLILSAFFIRRPARELTPVEKSSRAGRSKGLGRLSDELEAGDSMTCSNDQDRQVAAWEFRIDQEREQFKLYEHRRLSIELQATAITAAAITIAALLIAGSDRLSKLGDVIEYGIAVAIGSLVLAILFASCARFVSWRSPKRLGRPEPRRDLAVKESLEALRAAGESTPPCELRKLGLVLWNDRSLSAYELGNFKFKWLFRAVIALVVPVVFLLMVGVALII